MKIIHFFLITYVVSSVSLHAQYIDSTILMEPELRKNSIYIEGFGNAFLYSVNYDRLISIGDHQNMIVRLGASPGTGWGVLIVEGDYLIGGPKHFFDPGVGLTVFDFFSSKYYPQGFLIIRGGYRYMGKNGLLFRVGLIYNGTGKRMQWAFPLGHIWVGASVGYSFNL